MYHKRSIRRWASALLCCAVLVLLVASGGNASRQPDDSQPTQQQQQLQQQQHNAGHFWSWRCPRSSTGSCSSSTITAAHPSSSSSRQKQQLNLDRRLFTFWGGRSYHLADLSTTTSSSSSSSSRRRILQVATAPAATPYQPPKVFLSNVTASIVTSYSWSISRTSSATSIAVTADGADKKQLGYTLVFSQNLNTTTYTVAGSLDITNVMGTSQLTLLSATVYVGTNALDVACRGLPGTPYTMQPAEVLSCPFRVDLPSAPATGVSITGFVQTSYGRKPSDNSPAVSFENCGASGANGSSCTARDVGKCVTVTDGSRIVNRYQDKAGAAAAGPVQVSQSQLFEVSSATSSNLGPPRVEPTLPNAGPPAEPAPTSNYVQPTADDSWWTPGHRRRQNLLDAQEKLGRSLQQDLGNSANNANTFTWPIPTITGVRPPVGESGVPAGTDPPKQICQTTQFSFGMIFGPLVPAACGIFEVDSTAAAAYVDRSQSTVTEATYTYLQVICPAPQSGGKKLLAIQQISDPAAAASNTSSNSSGAAQPVPAITPAAAAAASNTSSSSSGAAQPVPAVTPAAAAASNTPSSSSSSGATQPVPAITPAAADLTGSSSSNNVRPPLRLRITKIQPVLLTSYSWSLSGAPAARTNPSNNVTEVGCWVRAERSKPTTTQVITGTVRLGNPMAQSDPAAAVIYVTGVSVTAVVTTGASGQMQPVTVPAECKTSSSNGELQIMPYKRANCTFEIRVTMGPTPLFPLSGNILATATVKISRGSAATADLSSDIAAFAFDIPPPPITDNNSSTSAAATPSAASSSSSATQQYAVGSCAQISSGIVLAELLPANAAAAASDPAAAAALDGSSGQCTRVCGATDPVKEISVYAPVDGYNRYQCGEHPVFCVGGVIPDNGDWDGIGQLSPAMIVSNSTITVDGACYNATAAAAAVEAAAAAAANRTNGSSSVVTNPGGISNPDELPSPDDTGSTDGNSTAGDDSLTDAAADAGNATAASSSSSSTSRGNSTAPKGRRARTFAFAQAGDAASSSSSSDLPVEIALSNVTAERVIRYVWNSKLDLAAATAAGSSSSSGLTLTARYSRRITSTTGTIRGQIQLQAAATRSSSSSKIDTVTNITVLVLLPCGGSVTANITSPDCSAAAVRLPATCDFEATGVDAAAAAAVVLAKAQAAMPVIAPPAAAAAAAAANNTTTVGGSVTLTIQSAPAIVTISKASQLDIDRCINVTSNFKLTPQGDVTSTDGGILTAGGSTAAAAAGSGVSPLLVPITPLPDGFCGSSEVQYKLTAGSQPAAAAATGQRR